MTEDRSSTEAGLRRVLGGAGVGFGPREDGNVFLRDLKPNDLVGFDLVDEHGQHSMVYGKFLSEDGNSVLYEDWGVIEINPEDPRKVIFRVDTQILRLPGENIVGRNILNDDSLRELILRNTPYSAYLGKFVSIAGLNAQIMGRLAKIAPPGRYYFSPTIIEQHTPYGTKYRKSKDGEFVEVSAGLIVNGIVRPVREEDLEAMVRRSEIGLAIKNNIFRRVALRLLSGKQY